MKMMTAAAAAAQIAIATGVGTKMVIKEEKKWHRKICINQDINTINEQIFVCQISMEHEWNVYRRMRIAMPFTRKTVCECF